MLARTLLLVVGVLVILPGCCTAQGTQDWWTHMQLYQIYPRSFMDSDGDGIGDIKGIISKLDHLVNIGVTATWLSPVFPSPMKDFGYDISDYYNIAPEYGTIADLELLIAQAKAKNIKILMDFVPNHTSDQCEWFKKSVRREPGFENFYVWHDGKDEGKSPPSNWVSVFRGPAWTYNTERKQWYLHQFLSSQPDLNFRDPNVITEMNNVLKFWLNKGVAGFRVDAIPHLVEVDVGTDGMYPDEPLSGETSDKDSYSYLDHIYTRERAETYQTVYKWRAILDEVTKSTGSETRVLLMEAMSDEDLVMKYYGDSTQEGAHFPFNFNLVSLNHEADAEDLAERIETWFDALPDGRVTNWVIGNHDQPRVATRFGPERSDGIVMIAMLLPGVAVTYNGEEIGMTNQYLSWADTVDPSGCNAGIDLFNSTSRDPERTPFQWDSTRNAGFSTTSGKTWLPVADNYLTLNLLQQTKDERSPYKFYRAMSQLRQKEVIKRGDLWVKTLNNGQVFAFSRGIKGLDRIFVVVNTGNNLLTVDLKTRFENLKNELTVLASNVESTRRQGDIIKYGTFVLYPNEALALSKGIISAASSWTIILIIGFIILIRSN